MCGLVAVLDRKGGGTDRGVIQAMRDLVAHRGPDGAGCALLDGFGSEISGNFTVGLGHRRLSILDLSEAGRQPMRRGRCWIVFNGEIYNFVELRARLEGLGHAFETRTDTEVILAAYQEWGTGCFEVMRGMWALVLLDGQKGKLVLSRDRLGIKPLYLARTPSALAVVSEPKQLTGLPGFSLAPDDETVRLYLASGYEDQNRSFFRDVVPLTPGTFLSFDTRTGKELDREGFWHPEKIVPAIENGAEAATLFREAFLEAVRIHLRSDVPVGCALSGGMDSTAIAMAVASDESANLQTFSVTFPGFALDERAYMEIVVRRARCQPHFVTPTPRQFLEDLTEFVWKHDEPVGHLSQYAAWAVSRLTRESGVPVTLNGQGGDEILSGYWEHYAVFLLKQFRPSGVSRLVKDLLGALLPSGNAHIWRELPGLFRRVLERKRPRTLFNLIEGPDGAVSNLISRLVEMTDQERRVYEVRELTLPRLLKWDDRNFMAFSVEGRYPFLDHVLMETCLAMNPELLYRRGFTKVPLRDGLADYLPDEIRKRKTKIGFESPQEDWLLGELHPAVLEKISPDAPVWSYVSRPSAAELLSKIESRASVTRAEHNAIFRLFMTSAWMERFGLEKSA